VAAILEEIRGLSFKKKKAAAFGSFGWSGEGLKMITEKLREGGFEIVSDGIREMWAPDKRVRENCLNFGKAFVEKLNK